uniref:Uncharacterized protein n=1 Tax=Ralstonia solanacearum CFBP2957 TaxID=859656 RepID=D8P4W2_RALSL|nr:protein of unknown function [Ralstonia solanacearum CFBP2957]
MERPPRPGADHCARPGRAPGEPKALCASGGRGLHRLCCIAAGRCLPRQTPASRKNFYSPYQDCPGAATKLHGTRSHSVAKSVRQGIAPPPQRHLHARRTP